MAKSCLCPQRERGPRGALKRKEVKEKNGSFLVVVGCRRSRENISKAKNIEAKIIRATQPSFEKKSVETNCFGVLNANFVLLSSSSVCRHFSRSIRQQSSYLL